MILNAMKRGRLAQCKECKALMTKEDVKVWHQTDDEDKKTGRVICKPCAMELGWVPTEAPERVVRPAKADLLVEINAKLDRLLALWTQPPDPDLFD